MLQESFHSTDDFMFRSFDVHSRIFKQKNLNEYFMISSGTNQFPMTSIWKECLAQEIESDFLYRWYAGSDGFPCITSAIKIFEDYISADSRKRNGFFHTGRKVCLATGGSGAASLVFQHLHEAYGKCRVVLVGMNYSLYDRLAKKHGFPVSELCGGDDPNYLPKMDDFSALERSRDGVKNIFVFSMPNNPTGDIYSLDDFSQIVSIISRLDGFILLDTVCNLVISDDVPIFWEEAITRNGMWGSCAVVNSFSKTDAVAGLRLGYVYGEDELISSCSRINADTIMNPPTFPAFAVVLTCMFRCMFLCDRTNRFEFTRDGFRNLFSRAFFVTTAIVTDRMRAYAEEVFDNTDVYYNKYIEEQLNNEQTIKTNYIDTVNVLRPLLKSTSEMKRGFNFIARFKHPFFDDELELIKKLIHNTGVAILTESSFSVRKVDTHDYFLRFSTACPKGLYHDALLKMADYLERWGMKL